MKNKTTFELIDMYEDALWRYWNCPYTEESHVGALTAILDEMAGIRRELAERESYVMSMLEEQEAFNEVWFEETQPQKQKGKIMKEIKQDTLYPLDLGGYREWYRTNHPYFIFTPNRARFVKITGEQRYDPKSGEFLVAAGFYNYLGEYQHAGTFGMPIRFIITEE